MDYLKPLDDSADEEQSLTELVSDMENLTGLV